MSTDFHVHLDLVDTAAIVAGDLTRVVDLGGNPARSYDLPGVEVVRAGQILTAVGGYPSDRAWAADAMFREVTADDVDAALDEQVACGASLIKVALNSQAGPVWPDELLREVVDRAHARGLPVVAHVQGTGQSARAAEAGVDAFAHIPWTEYVDDALLRHFAANVAWISTLRIHAGADRAIAVDNAARFHRAGGRILYGTDMGNGPSSGSVEHDELEALREAGLDEAAIETALTADWPLS